MINTTEAIEVVWARRREDIREVLKLIRIMVLAARQHTSLTESGGLVSAPQLWAMWELARAPGLRVLDLSKAMAVHAPTVKAMMTDLETRGLVSTLASGDNPNTARLSLTESGGQVLDATPGPAQGVIFAALEKLDDAALARLVDALQPLVSAMQPTDGVAASQPLADLLYRDVMPVNPH